MTTPRDLEALATDGTAALRRGSAATVIGERVKVVAVELQGNDRRGLVARVVRRGVTHVVSLADVRAEPGSALAGVIDRYRALLEIDLDGAGGVEKPAPGSGLPLGPGGVSEAVGRPVTQEDRRALSPRGGRHDLHASLCRHLGARPGAHRPDPGQEGLAPRRASVRVRGGRGIAARRGSPRSGAAPARASGRLGSRRRVLGRRR